MTLTKTTISLLLVLGLTGYAGTVPAGDDSIDEILKSTWEAHDLKPAKLCTSSEFLRRITLDLVGRVPSLEELKKFQRNPNRRKKIDELLASDEFARYWSEVWTAQLNGYVDAFDSNRGGLRIWLEKQIKKNRPYDKIVTDMMTASGSSAGDSAVNFIARNYYQATIKVSRSFLGVRIQCAQCHDHPFDRWTQEDFTNMTRFFQAMDRQYVTNGNVIIRDNVNKARGRKPKFLTGAKPVTTQWRSELSFYMTRSKPFARNYGNRMWYYFIGRGIVNPPDDFNQKNKPSIPELLEYLANKAKEQKWDIREMIRLICNSDAYRRSSVRTEDDPEMERYFAYRVLKPMTPEQMYDSLIVALDIKSPRMRRDQFIRAFVGQDIGADFTNMWDYRETVQDLMTKLTFSLVVPEGSLEELYQRILSRKPTARERKLCRGQDHKAVVFALMNSNEFFFNH